MTRQVSVLLVFLCLSTPALAQKRAFTLEDFYRVRSIGDVQVSRDGTRAVFTVTTSDLPRGKRATHIWLVDLAGSQPRQLTSSDAGDSSPSFAPDGKSLAFVRSRDGEANLYVLPLDGGEPKALTHISTGVSDPVWSPDGKWIAFSTDVYPECTDAMGSTGAMGQDACNKRIADTWQKGPLKAHMADALFYRQVRPMRRGLPAAADGARSCRTNWRDANVRTGPRSDHIVTLLDLGQYSVSSTWRGCSSGSLKSGSAPSQTPPPATLSRRDPQPRPSATSSRS